MSCIEINWNGIFSRVPLEGTCKLKLLWWSQLQRKTNIETLACSRSVYLVLEYIALISSWQLAILQIVFYEKINLPKKKWKTVVLTIWKASKHFITWHCIVRFPRKASIQNHIRRISWCCWIKITKLRFYLHNTKARIDIKKSH